MPASATSWMLKSPWACIVARGALDSQACILPPGCNLLSPIKSEQRLPFGVGQISLRGCDFLVSAAAAADTQ